jgi:hypothetical protein
MSSRSLRRIAFTLLLSAASLAPLHARGPVRSHGLVSAEPARAIVDFLLRLLDLVKESGDSGGGMDPNG